MTSITYNFDHDGHDTYKSSYSSGPANDKANILAKVAYTALLLTQPVHAEYVRATPWILRVSSASSSYQETKISQEAIDSVLIQPAAHAKEIPTAIVSADLSYTQHIAELRDEIISFNHLFQGWDGEGAEQISNSAIDGALNFVEFTPHQIEYDAFPESDGSVGMQADTAGGRILLSFADNGTAAYLIRINGAVHRGHGATNDTINKLLAIIV